MYKNRTNSKNFVKPNTKARNFEKKNTVRYPDHVFNLFLIINNNAEIRRFTALGIIKYLLKNEVISGKKNYVTFMPNKFSVTSDGLSREYFYTETFFLNALVASFASFSASAQNTIDIYTNAEFNKNIEDVVSSEEVSYILQSDDVDNDVEVSDSATDNTADVNPAESEE